MENITRLGGLFFLLFVIACAPSRNTASSISPIKNEVKFISATSQHWIAGREESGSGINYVIKVHKKTNDPVLFDTVWIASRPFKPSVVKSADNPPGVVELHCFYTKRPSEGGIQESPQVDLDAPRGFGDAFLIMRVGKKEKKKAMAIESIEKKPDIFYP